MKKIVITGATGFIGIHLIKEWLKKDCEIYAIIRPNSYNSDRIPHSTKVSIIELSMKDYSELPTHIGNCDYFYHLAWEGARAPLRDNAEMQKNNYEYSIEAFKAAQKMKCVFFLGSGSQAEYGSTNGIVDEEYPCNPNTEYGREKLNTYLTISSLAKESNIKFIWTRIFSIYGPFDYPGTLIMSCVEKMKRNERIEMTAGTQLWDYLYVEDVADAMVKFALKDNCDSGIYILASGDYHPLKEFIETVKKSLSSTSELAFGAIPYGKNGPINLMPNPHKVIQALDWVPRTSFSDGIIKTYKSI